VDNFRPLRTGSQNKLFPAHRLRTERRGGDLAELAPSPVIHFSTHTLIHRLCTGLAACLHRLSTGLCTAALDVGGHWGKTVGALRENRECQYRTERLSRAHRRPWAFSGVPRACVPPTEGALLMQPAGNQPRNTGRRMLAHALLAHALARWGQRYGLARTFWIGRAQTAELDCGVVP
jgi:hypothetical protein